MKLAMILTLASCAPSNATQTRSGEEPELSWWQWHDKKRATDAAVEEAENDPRGADMLKAVTIIRQSGRPPDIVNLQVGGMIVGSYARPPRVYPRESLAEGFALLEKAAVGGGEGQQVAPQRLRMWFERGVGQAPDQAMKPDPVVAACWLAVEERRPEDPHRCIALRKQRTGK